MKKNELISIKQCSCNMRQQRLLLNKIHNTLQYLYYHIKFIRLISYLIILSVRRFKKYRASMGLYINFLNISWNFGTFSILHRVNTEC